MSVLSKVTKRDFWKLAGGLFFLPKIKSYKDARKIFEEKCLYLGSHGFPMEILVFSGEQSYTQSKNTIDAFSKRECRDHIEKFIFGGGPGISIKENTSIRSLGSPEEKNVRFYFDDPNPFRGKRFTEVRWHDYGTKYGSEGPPDDLYESHPYMKFYKGLKADKVDTQFLIEPRKGQEDVKIERQHIALVKIKDRNGTFQIPLAVVEDLHLPFEPRDAVIFEDIREGDSLYGVFEEIKKRFLSVSDRLEDKPPCRIVDRDTAGV